MESNGAVDVLIFPIFLPNLKIAFDSLTSTRGLHCSWYLYCTIYLYRSQRMLIQRLPTQNEIFKHDLTRLARSYMFLLFLALNSKEETLNVLCSYHLIPHK